MTVDAAPNPNQPALIRHIIPVVVGVLITGMLTIVTTNWFSVRGLLPAPGAPATTGVLLLSIAYRGLFVVVGSHMAARLAPAGQPRIRYAIAAGVLVLAVNVVAALAERDAAPLWFLIANIALPVPCAIIGGGTAARRGR